MSSDPRDHDRLQAAACAADNAGGPWPRTVRLETDGALLTARVSRTTRGTLSGYVRVPANTPNASAVMRMTEHSAGVHGGLTWYAEVYTAAGGGAEHRRRMPSPEFAALGGTGDMAPPGTYMLVAYELGFDAGHSADWVPPGDAGLASHLTALFEGPRDTASAVYRDTAYMADECRRLAAAMRAAMRAV